MSDQKIQPMSAQGAETATRKRGARTRRLSEVMPELRSRITPLFSRGVPVERIAEDLDVSPLQLLEHVVREYSGARHPGPFVVRKDAKSETTVRAFRTLTRTA